jgi:hypothetical protein
MSTDSFSRDKTLSDSRDWIAANRGKGVDCPVCDRKVKEYSRPINRAQALAITRMYVAAGNDYVNVRNLRSQRGYGTADKNNEISKLAHWGLVQQHPDPKRGGTWRVTELGGRWVRGQTKVPRNVIIYQADKTADGDEMVLLRDILEQGADSDFDLRAVMADIGNVQYKKPNSSGSMNNDETLYRRSRRKTNSNGVQLNNVDDDSDGLFASSTDEMQRFPNSLNHEIFFGDETVAVAREWLHKNLFRGVFCPTCDRIAVFKNYPMKDSMARLLIEMYRHHGTQPVDVREFYLEGELVDRNNYVAKIAQRGLVAEIPVRRGDGGKAGWYRLTQDGVDWIFGRSETPATVLSYNYYSKNGQSKGTVSVTDVFDTSARWTYRELMEGLGATLEDDDLFSELVA